jgi:hypothetical protein
VEGAEAPDEVDGVDADDFAVGEAGGDGVEGDGGRWVVEGGDEDERVGDVEVGVAGGEALAFEETGAGMGSSTISKGLPMRLRAALQAVEIFGEREVVLVGGVGFDAVRMVFRRRSGRCRRRGRGCRRRRSRGCSQRVWSMPR